MACSYLTERKITVNYARETVTKSTNKGCVQGSICGPTFWNIIIDSLLQRLTDAKVHCQAFADDVVLAFSSESSSTIENAANEAMKIVTKWGSENKLNFAPQKQSYGAAEISKPHHTDGGLPNQPSRRDKGARPNNRHEAKLPVTCSGSL
ncbi:Putative 115 kDa protein in type-1 retrotransposable element R1DM [Eumeta japonica]|uniref:115 kDa protein in type-1 retrotransposable element R1DM n=1 Tax=Eumeta variegata TaxID=151549 RepID=A0A4C1Z3Z2_EUMVA|nr:Putative 115 kDa protein in type-1 retrotransposable element R1DM [Eumeta japonica]